MVWAVLGALTPEPGTHAGARVRVIPGGVYSGEGSSLHQGCDNGVACRGMAYDGVRVLRVLVPVREATVLEGGPLPRRSTDGSAWHVPWGPSAHPSSWLRVRMAWCAC